VVLETTRHNKMLRYFPRSSPFIPSFSLHSFTTLLQAVRRLKGTVRQLDAIVKDEAPDWLKGRKIGEAIADLEKRLQDKHGPNWPDQPTSKPAGPSTGPGGARGASPSIAGRIATANKAGAAPSGEKGLEDAKKKVEAEIGMLIWLLISSSQFSY
jgi:hypothetical protein